MTGTDRRTSEQEFHDRQAALRAESFAAGAAHLRFDVDAYLNHETWVRPALAALGDLRGKTALDYGCGHGMAAVALARAGATVTAFDLSPGYVAECRERAGAPDTAFALPPGLGAESRARASANGVRVECVTADGEDLPFADASFDAVWGNAILHHLDLARAGRELKRVLKPGGVAAFCEPWGGNPLLGLARRRLPYPGKDRTPDEQPLTRRDLKPLRALFPVVRVTGFQLFGMVRRVWKNGRVLRALDAFDARLLRAVPALHNWCRYAVLELRTEAIRA